MSAMQRIREPKILTDGVGYPFSLYEQTVERNTDARESPKEGEYFLWLGGITDGAPQPVPIYSIDEVQSQRSEAACLKNGAHFLNIGEYNVFLHNLFTRNLH